MVSCSPDRGENGGEAGGMQKEGPDEASLPCILGKSQPPGSEPAGVPHKSRTMPIGSRSAHRDIRSDHIAHSKWMSFPSVKLVKTF